MRAVPEREARYKDCLYCYYGEKETMQSRNAWCELDECPFSREDFKQYHADIKKLSKYQARFDKIIKG